MANMRSRTGWGTGTRSAGGVPVLAVWVTLWIATAGCGFATRAQNAAGVRFYQQGQYSLAADQFRKAIQTHPHGADGYYNLARVLHDQGQASAQPELLVQAETYYRQCLQRNPNHRDGHRGLAVLLAQQGRGEEAFRLLEDWAARSPMIPDPRIELARLTEEFGDQKAAKEYLVDALQTDPHNPRALAALGRIREAEGDAAQALANYQRALAADPRDVRLARHISELASRSGFTLPPTAPTGSRVVTNPAPGPR